MCEECGCENVEIHSHDHHNHTLQSGSSEKLVIEQAVMSKMIPMLKLTANISAIMESM